MRIATLQTCIAKRVLAVVLAGLAGACAATPGRAFAPRELVHPYAPSGPAEVAGTQAAGKVLRTMQHYTMPAFTDVLATYAAQALQGEAEPFTTVRKPRRGGTEAASYVAAAAPDGRTLLLATSSPDSTGSARAPLEPVALVATMPYVLISRSAAKPGALIEHILTSRSRFLVGSAGERSAGHLAIDVLRSRAGFSLDPVAYNGGLAALNALVTKQVSVAVVPLPAALPYLGGGRLEALVIAQAQRHASIPDVPTSAEAGLSALQAVTSFVVFAPAATPRALVGELRAALARGFDAEGARQLFGAYGVEIAPADARR